MRGIKIPLQDFALKVQGVLMREGGRICGTLRYIYVSYVVRPVHAYRHYARHLIGNMCTRFYSQIL